MDWQSGQTYNGNGQTLSGYWQFSNLKGLVIQNYVFNDGRFKFTDCSGVIFKNCKFQNASANANSNGRVIDIYGTFDDGAVISCQFNNIQADSCMFCDNGQISRTQFNWNTFNNVIHGMHFSWGGSQKKNDVEIAFNQFSNVRHFAIECQNAVWNLNIHHNFCDDFVPNDSRMGMSIATGPMKDKTTYAKGVHIHDNWMGDPARNGNNDAYAAFEVMGADSEVDHNGVKGLWGCLVLYGWSTDALKFHDNAFMGGTDMAHPFKPEDHGIAPKQGNIYGNQTPPSALDRPSVSDVFNNKCWWQTGGIPTPTPTPIPTPNISGTALSAHAIEIILTGDAGSLQRKSTNGGDPFITIATISAGTKLYQDRGLSPNWEYDYQFNGGRVITVQCMAQDPVITKIPVKITITYSDGTTVDLPF